jgi:hypothetical protein
MFIWFLLIIGGGALIFGSVLLVVHLIEEKSKLAPAAIVGAVAVACSLLGTIYFMLGVEGPPDPNRRRDPYTVCTDEYKLCVKDEQGNWVPYKEDENAPSDTTPR